MMKRINSGGKYFKKATCLLMCYLILNTSLPVVMAGPTGGVVDTNPTNGGGAATITYGTGIYGNTTQVDVLTNRTIINWDSLDTLGGDVDVREILSFSQGGLTNSAVLNRVSGPVTQFNGDLVAPGMSIFIVNPAGITFGSGSTINVTQLVASGLNMENGAFHAVLDDPVNNKMEFAGGDGNVLSFTNITGADKVYLIGKRVYNVGAILAPNGLVVMAAGDEVRLFEDGSDVSVVVSGLGDGNPDVRNSGNVNISNGKIVLAAGDIFSRAISNVGILSASGGSITAQAACVRNNGYMVVNSSSGSAGSISLKGTEEVSIGPDVLGNTGLTMANAVSGGHGGTITIESEGTVTLEDNAFVEAKGGTYVGNGGHIKISGEHVVIKSDIDASPGNTNYNPGTLEVVTANVTIAPGEKLGQTDTIYEDDIEALSQAGTSLVVNAQDSITVQDIPDDGIIDGRYGNIELHATGADSIVSFEDNTDTISTTLGDIVMEAGSGGIDIGNLQTAKDVSDISPTPGQITLTTTNEGDITTGNLAIKDGWGHAEINVNASGDLTVNGDVAVGRDSAINNIPLDTDAEAMIYLNAEGNMVLEGDIRADADGIHEGAVGGVTKAYIGISGGSSEVGYGDVTINGDLVATASSTNQGTSEATIEIDSWGFINWGPEAAVPLADADEAHVESRTTASEEVAGSVAQIIVTGQGNAPAPQTLPDFSEIHMGNEVTGNVLDNDIDPEGEPLTAALVDGPSHAESFTLNEDGSYSYTSEPGYVGTDSFTYTASAGGGTSAPILVTITMTNSAPVSAGDAKATHMGDNLDGTIQDFVSDPDEDPLITAIVTETKNGTLTLDENGNYTYKPDEGYVGTDSFTFTAYDGELDAEPVQLTATILVTNTQPELNDDTADTLRGTAVVIDVLINDSDPDNDPFTIDSFTYEGAGTVVLNEDNTFTYTPAKGFFGKDSFTYMASDGQLDAEPVETTVLIEVGLGYLPPAPLNMPTGPGLERSNIETSGCPALTKWVAVELGTHERMMEIFAVNGLASTVNIQPCEAYTNLKQAA
ncbi:MAG: Ig-like domain-containing protein, partial [Planctomycetota bacterium]